MGTGDEEQDKYVEESGICKGGARRLVTMYLCSWCVLGAWKKEGWANPWADNSATVRAHLHDAPQGEDA